MKKFPLIATVIITPSIAVASVISAISLATSRTRLDEATITEAYACAYRKGQLAIQTRLPSLFPNEPGLPEELRLSCDRFHQIAARHGFTQE